MGNLSRVQSDSSHVGLWVRECTVNSCWLTAATSSKGPEDLHGRLDEASGNLAELKRVCLKREPFLVWISFAAAGSTCRWVINYASFHLSLKTYLRKLFIRHRLSFLFLRTYLLDFDANLLLFWWATCWCLVHHTLTKDVERFSSGVHVRKVLTGTAKERLVAYFAWLLEVRYKDCCRFLRNESSFTNFFIKLANVMLTAQTLSCRGIDQESIQA